MDLISAILTGTSIYALWKKTQPPEPAPGQMLITPGELAMGVPAVTVTTPDILVQPPIDVITPIEVPIVDEEFLFAPQVCPPLCGPGGEMYQTPQEELIRQVDPRLITITEPAPSPNALVMAGLPLDAVFIKPLMVTPTVVQESWDSPTRGRFIVTISMLGDTKHVAVAADIPMGLTDPGFF